MPLPREERIAASLLRTAADYIEAGRIQDAKDCIEDAAALLEGSRDHDSSAQQHSTVE